MVVPIGSASLRRCESEMIASSAARIASDNERPSPISRTRVSRATALATSPYSWPPMPSATSHSPSEPSAQYVSSLCARRSPTWVACPNSIIAAPCGLDLRGELNTSGGADAGAIWWAGHSGPKPETQNAHKGRFVSGGEGGIARLVHEPRPSLCSGPASGCPILFPTKLSNPVGLSTPPLCRNNKGADGPFLFLAERVGFEPTLRQNRKPDFESG